MNQIFQWSVMHPYLATLIAYIALVVIYALLFNILQIIDNMLTCFRWWKIVSRLRDKDRNITRENIDSFRKSIDKIEKNDTENTSNREEHR